MSNHATMALELWLALIAAMAIGSIFYFRERKAKRFEKIQDLFHILMGFTREIEQIEKKLKSIKYEEVLDDFKTLQVNIKDNSIFFQSFVSDANYRDLEKLAIISLPDKVSDDIRRDIIQKKFSELRNKITLLMFEVSD